MKILAFKFLKKVKIKGLFSSLAPLKLICCLSNFLMIAYVDIEYPPFSGEVKAYTLKIQIFLYRYPISRILN